MRFAAALVCLGLGCGRVGFDTCPACAQGGLSADAMPDTTPAPPVQLVDSVGPGWAVTPDFTITLSQTAGNFAVLAAYFDGTAGLTVLDTLGENWMSLPSERAGCANPNADTEIWYASLTHTGSNTITLHYQTQFPIGAFALEYSGIADVIPVDTASGQAPTGLTGSLTAGTLATTGWDLIVTVFATRATGPLVAGPGWQPHGHDDGFASLVEDQLVPAGTYTPAASLPAGQLDKCWTGASAAFRAR